VDQADKLRTLNATQVAPMNGAHAGRVEEAAERDIRVATMALRSKKKVEMTPVATQSISLASTTDETAQASPADLDANMLSPTTEVPERVDYAELFGRQHHDEGIEMGAKAVCDEESIAFGVMYFPRTRVRRTDKYNCDTRVLREPGADCEQICPFIDAGPAPSDTYNMGFVLANGQVSTASSNP